jgi:hypothetical protein
MKQREIKFRVWDGRQKAMAKDYVITIFDRDLPQVQYQGFHRDGEDWVLMQFTGHHDKNGKEIYEGDILTWPDTDPFEVKWGAGMWEGIGLPEEWNDCVIIGNIYENPELLATKPVEDIKGLNQNNQINAEHSQRKGRDGGEGHQVRYAPVGACEEG